MIDYPEDAASQRRRALGPRPTLAQLDALLAELAALRGELEDFVGAPTA